MKSLVFIPSGLHAHGGFSTRFGKNLGDAAYAKVLGQREVKISGRDN
jgi:hypothetical protein